MKVVIEGVSNVIAGLKSMVEAIPSASENMLNEVASLTKSKMASEAPHNTGALAGSVSVSMPSRFTRIIEPLARNFAPGNQYGYWVEAGSSPGHVPNVFSIAQYFGVSKKVAWAIALSIKDKGTPANPFVSRTFDWVNQQINLQLTPFIRGITANFIKGAL